MKKADPDTGPTYLKRILLDCGVTLAEFKQMVGRAKGTVWSAINRGVLPKKKERFISDVRKAVTSRADMMQWLKERKLTVDDLFSPLPKDQQSEKMEFPKGNRKKISNGMRKHLDCPAIVPGDPSAFENHKEAEMITHAALKHFKIFRSPFINDVTDPRDIFFSEDHYFIKEMMLDTARHAGFTAVYGEVGSGKSVIRKAVFHALRSEDIKVIYPAIIDSSRITAAALMEAIIMDISEETPKRSLEQRSRQALKLLRNRARSGMKQVLMIEEAHLLNVAAIKALKRIYELEDGFTKLIGIIVIGQPELKYILDESVNPQIREVARRVTRAEINGMGGDLPRYLEHKFKRVGAKVGDIFDDEAFAAMTRRLTDKLDRREVSRAFPLTVNNLTANAMNLAASMGEARVTAEVVLAL